MDHAPFRDQTMESPPVSRHIESMHQTLICRGAELSGDWWRLLNIFLQPNITPIHEAIDAKFIIKVVD
jgi:hypothetical protein